MSRKGKILLCEVLGEEKFQSYEEGDWIGVKSPDGYEYFAKKGRFHVPIKREKTQESDEVTEEQINQFFEQNPQYLGTTVTREVVRNHLSQQRWGGSNSSGGKLNGNDLYDAVATYVQSAKLGKLNWGCGNIDIDLPNNMPPQDTTFFTFLKRGIKRTSIWIRRFPRNYVKAVTEAEPLPLVASGFGIFSGIFIGGILFDEYVIDITVGHVLSFQFLSILIFAFHSGYLRWKNQWGVNGE